MNIKIEGWKVTIHNENGDRLELNGEFEAEFFKKYDNKQLMLGGVVGRSEQLPQKSEHCVSISPEPCKHKGVCKICS